MQAGSPPWYPGLTEHTDGRRERCLVPGYDLYRSGDINPSIALLGPHKHNSAENKVNPARGKAIIDTQISIAVTPGTQYGRVAPRSDLGGWFYPPTSGAGVIDAN